MENRTLKEKIKEHFLMFLAK